MKTIFITLFLLAGIVANAQNQDIEDGEPPVTEISKNYSDMGLMNLWLEKDILHLDLNFNYQTQIDISIFDINGRKVLSRKIYCNAAPVSWLFETSGLVSGIYVVSVDNNIYRKSQKIRL